MLNCIQNVSWNVTPHWILLPITLDYGCFIFGIGTLITWASNIIRIFFRTRIRVDKWGSHCKLWPGKVAYLVRAFIRLKDYLLHFVNGFCSFLNCHWPLSLTEWSWAYYLVNMKCSAIHTFECERSAKFSYSWHANSHQ